MRERLLEQVAALLILCADGRNDSPRYSAQYCTYSLMDITSNKVVALKVVDSRGANDKSVNMEIGFSKSATPITEVVIDQHIQIMAVMSEYGKH